MGQHAHPDWSTSTQLHMQQTVMHCVFWHLFIGISISFFSSLSYSSSSIGADCTGQSSLPTCINEPWRSMTLSPVHQSIFFGPLLLGPDHCMPRTSHKSCSFGNALILSSSHYTFDPCHTHSNPYACHFFFLLSTHQLQGQHVHLLPSISCPHADAIVTSLPVYICQCIYYSSRVSFQREGAWKSPVQGLHISQAPFIHF